MTFAETTEYKNALRAAHEFHQREEDLDRKGEHKERNRLREAGKLVRLKPCPSCGVISRCGWPELEFLGAMAGLCFECSYRQASPELERRAKLERQRLLEFRRRLPWATS